MSIQFHLPDFVSKFHLNMLLSKLMEEYPDAFYDDIRIGSVYGVYPSSLWNGGHVAGGSFPDREIRYVAEQLNNRGISVRFTFNNPLINKSHLDDKFCNRCLELTERTDDMNGVIVVSPELEKYIRSKYPHFRIISSTCKQVTDFGALCEELEKYDTVVLDYSLNNNWELLEKLPHKEKVEILVNPACPSDAQYRKKFFGYLARTQMAYCEHVKKNGPNVPFKNPEDFRAEHLGYLIYDAAKHPAHVSPELLYGRYKEMGFENFKIEGRSAPMLDNMETYMYYMVKPEHRDRMRLIYLMSLETSGVITIND